jgi:dihydroneopterin aldolase
MDRIGLSGVKLQCHLGVPAEERTVAQEILVDVEMGSDVTRAAESDAVGDTVDYTRVRDVLEAVAQRREYALIESLAAAMAAEILGGFAVEEVRILVKKPAALWWQGVDCVWVEVVRRRDG